MFYWMLSEDLEMPMYILRMCNFLSYCQQKYLLSEFLDYNNLEVFHSALIMLNGDDIVG